MFKKILLISLIFFPFCIFSQIIGKDTRTIKPRVYLIGSIHNMHFNPDKNYSLNDLLEQIRSLKPDLVCGEITPDAFNQAMEGYFPPEAAFLAEMASELNYRFIPVDWRLDFATQTMAYNHYPPSVKQQRLQLVDELKDRMKASKKTSFYDTLHDQAILSLLDSLYEKIIGPDALAEIAAGSWHERNRRAVENGLANRGDARTIVFVFGVDHVPQLQHQLKALGIDALIAPRMFTPSTTYKVSQEVLDRWTRNLENLKRIRDKKIDVSLDSYQKVMDSKRIENLEEAIQKSR
ncbi:hypothetical protein EV201_1019 [Ancylomarina subtilis]|uniref:Uncharacterized protein n=1 Tax=Ancylomarina subtilis TaxID=1639035 RepID=A0A4Q7VJJ6_9BACT|nr:hypothetical protein [Ancylomarina subtilis]RZT96381.1 hypothetical protein EV201_1019 [Ancylomarina subtilis]